MEDYSDLNNHDITVGDVILTADGVTLETTSDLLDVLETHKPGETVRLEIQKRGSGNVVTVDAVLAESRSNARSKTTRAAADISRGGASFCFSPQVKNLSL